MEVLRKNNIWGMRNGKLLWTLALLVFAIACKQANDNGKKKNNVLENKLTIYKVEHALENIENDEFTVKETEEKMGEVGKNTEAKAKQYEGFILQAFEQTLIKEDGSTVVRLKYKRAIISLILDLDGGECATALYDGENGKKLLKGKFEANVIVENPTKQGAKFINWEPSLPHIFLVNDATIYTAKWEHKTVCRLEIAGDERVEVLEPKYIDLSIETPKTFGEVKTEIEKRINLKSEWSNNDYGFYDWRVDGEKGEEILDSTQITKNMKIYARTNYKRFRLSGSQLEGYESEKPRGRIFLPKESKTIKENAFENCESLTSVDLSPCSELVEIEKSVFSWCNNLKYVDLTACYEVTTIANNAFEYCGLVEIDLSSCNKLIEIGLETFKGCNHLKTVNLTGCSAIISIESGAFGDCENLISIDLSSCIKLKKIGKEAFSMCSNLKTVNLSGCNEITIIDDCAFIGCTSLESMNLSSCTKLEEIGNEVFSLCDKLKTVNLRGCNKLKFIGREMNEGRVFSNCSSLESVDLSSCIKLEKIEDRAFENCSGLKKLDLTACSEIATIGESVFENCSSLESIDLSPCIKLKDIRQYAFIGCANLKSVNLSASITTIGEEAFSKCSNLESIDLSYCTNFLKIAYSVFADCNNATIKLPISITEIERYAFGGEHKGIGIFTAMCKKVLVPNETIKQLVKDSEYPEDRIEIYH